MRFGKRGKLYFTCDVLEAIYLPQGWSPLPNVLPSLPPRLPYLMPKPPKCAAKCAAEVAAKPGAKRAAGEPILVARVEHVHLYKAKCSHRKNGTLSLSTPDMHPCKQFPSHVVVHMPSCPLFCFVSRVSCLVFGGEGGEGNVAWGRFPWGCDGTVVPIRLLDKRGGEYLSGVRNFPVVLLDFYLLKCLSARPLCRLLGT